MNIRSIQVISLRNDWVNQLNNRRRINPWLHPRILKLLRRKTTQWFLINRFRDILRSRRIHPINRLLNLALKRNHRLHIQTRNHRHIFNRLKIQRIRRRNRQGARPQAKTHNLILARHRLRNQTSNRIIHQIKGRLNKFHIKLLSQCLIDFTITHKTKLHQCFTQALLVNLLITQGFLQLFIGNQPITH